MLTRKFEGRRCRIFVKEEEEEERVFQLCVGSAARRGRGWLESRSRDVGRAAGTLYHVTLLWGDCGLRRRRRRRRVTIYGLKEDGQGETREWTLHVFTEYLCAPPLPSRINAAATFAHPSPVCPSPRELHRSVVHLHARLNHLTHINHESTTTM